MTQSYSAKVLEHNIPTTVSAGSTFFAHVYLRNNSNWTWQQHSPNGNVIVLLLKIGDTVVGACPFPLRQVAPQENVLFSFRWVSPDKPGKFTVELELAEQGVAILATLLKTKIKLTNASKDRSISLVQTAFRHNPWYYLPSQGVYQSSRGGHYPLFVKTASGSRFHDADNHEYIDYVCGWGACLLGYADPRIAKAVSQSLQLQSLTTLPNQQELELTGVLCNLFPSAEMVLYGKNGSDVCTAAVRLARAFTHRPIVLFCGYHGWQDWNAEAFGFTHAAIPEHQPPVVHSFATRNPDALKNLFSQHSDRIAAVIIEPAAQIEGIDGPIREADSEYLSIVSELCKENGSLLIFDEIFTGFRYLNGSVQQTVKLKPDLTCLGKALSGGMPLSALIGRRDIFETSMYQIAYDATFKGEPHSFAAALQAISIYQQEDVVDYVWNFGRRLMAEINSLCKQFDIPARMVGLPIRMTLAFEQIPDAVFMRTIVQQQLLLHGILCFRGVMIPSYAHTHDDLKQTLAAFRSAFKHLTVIRDRNKFISDLEIPLVQ
ncbi:MAG: aminotransferase class III-fold pyridoxal phosphate-dependent enzyme [Cyanobacteria bacterium P01_F01_bin.13]